MRLTLVERQEARLRCVPDLGIAHLLGQCKKEGITANLVQGSPETLKCLLDDSVFDLFADEYKNVVKERGETWFKDFLRFNYEIATSSEISDKTNPESLEDLWQLTTYMRDKVWPVWLPEQLYSKIEKTKPDVVGFSLWDFYSYPQLNKALVSIMERLKQESGMRVLVGGPGTTTQTSRKEIQKIFNPDYIVHHEGEEALIKLLENSDRRIPNVSTKDYDSECKPVKDLDALAIPDFSQYDLDSFFLPERVLPLMTSRGCDWSRCAFCNHHASYKGYREHSPERVAEVIETYKKKYNTEMIMFHDETFTSDHARRLTDHLPQAYYYSYASPKGFDKPLLKKMYDKGFRVLVWGVESGSQEVLNSMRKGTDIREVERIIRDAHGVGITNVTFIMFGFPGETKEQARETVEFLRRNSQYIERHATTQFMLMESSPIWINPDMWGVKIKKNFNYSVKDGMSPKDVGKFLQELNKENVKTAANTKYYMPGDSEFRPYFFMQVAHGEGSGNYPVRNGILSGNEILPSLLLKNVSRPRIELSEKDQKLYEKCDGKHRVDGSKFKEYPYVVYYEHPF